LEEVLLGLLDTLGDRRGHLLRLAVADADGAVAVAHHDERGEAEAAAALDDLGDAVDGDDALDEGVLLGCVARATVATVTATVVAAPPARVLVARLVGGTRGGAGVAALPCSHQRILCFRVGMVVVVTGTDRPRGRRRRPQRPDRGTCCRHGRTRPRRRPWPSHARRRARRPCGPWRSYRRRAHAGPPRATRPTRASGRSCRPRPGP